MLMIIRLIQRLGQDILAKIAAFTPLDGNGK